MGYTEASESMASCMLFTRQTHFRTPLTSNLQSDIASAGNHSYNVYNAANMLTASNGSAYTNDWNGNTLSGGGRTNVWDSQNRLVQTTFDGSTTGFTYGPDGLRRTATTGGVTTQYILDGQNVAQEVSRRAW